MGSTLFRILSESGNSVTGIDFHNNGNMDDLIDQADVAVIATPFNATVDYLNDLSSRITCIEVTSSKCAMQKFRNRMISIHPLFGPHSFRNSSLKNIIYISDISPSGSLKLLQTLFADFNIIPMTAIEHDFLISRIQVIPYIMSLLAKQLSYNTVIKTRSKNILDAVAAICDEQNMTVLRDTIVMNPFSIDVFDEIEKQVKRLGGEMSDSCSNFWLQH